MRPANYKWYRKWTGGIWKLNLYEALDEWSRTHTFYVWERNTHDVFKRNHAYRGTIREEDYTRSKIRYEHHGKSVVVQKEDRGKHRQHCLCWQGCKKFKPTDREHNCPIANLLYANNVAYGTITPVWECPEYE